MALGKRWSLTFKSLNNTTCSVYIYDEGWTGEVTTLIGAADPFYWEEDNSESLLTVLRYRTGYLRIIEPEYNSLIALYPTSSTSRYVEFYYGERLDFTGYLQVQNFQMDWVASPRILEFPIISPLGICETRKFSLYTTPTRITLGACLFNILTDLNNHAASGSRYTRVIFPDTGPEFTGSINTMVISGFSDQFSHADPDSPVFAAEYYNYLLEGICNAYGWILHDTPDAFIFTRFDWDGSYAYYDLTTLAVPTNKQTIANVAGNDVNALLDSFKVMDANATENLIQPLKSLTLEYQGRDIETADMSLARTYTQGVIPGGKFGFDSNPQYTPGIVWLKSADNEFTGARLLDTNSLSNGRTATPGCNLTYSGTKDKGYHDRILIGWPTDWSVDSELFQWKIYQPPVGDCNFEMEVSWGTTIAELGHEQRSTDLIFGFWMESGGKYYNFDTIVSSAGFVSNSRVIEKKTADENGKIIITIINVPVGVLTVGFVVGRVNGPEMVSIDNISLSRRTFTFAEYTEVQNPSDMITGNDAGNEEGNITLSLNCYRNDTHLIGLTPMSSKFTEYTYLFEAMNRVVCRFAASDYDTLKNYLAKWRFWIKQWRWRIIAVAFDPWDDIYTLTLHRSPILTNYSYLADSGDNVFQSLDEYLFTVLTDEAPEPPTPDISIPTITPDAGSILPSTTITISITSPATGAEYSFDNETWIPYSAPFTLASDSTVYARATDGNGNYSGVVSNAYTILPYDAEVEYIETVTGAYIDTNIIPSNTHGMMLDFIRTQTTDKHYMGMRQNASTNTRFVIGQGNSLYVGWGTTNSISGYGGLVHVKVEANLYNSRKIFVDNADKNITLSTLSFTPTYPIFIGTSDVAGTAGSNLPMKIYAAQITNGNNLIFDGIPVRKNGKGCLYDRVSGTLFENAGTGTITYGNDV